MRAVLIESFGGPDQLYIGEWPKPHPGIHEILVRVEATALNRADILQREGKYPPPEGESTVLGLEMAGVVESVGQGVAKWKPGDAVCGLLGGGGYAEYAVIHEDLALPVPEGLTAIEAAGIPEVFLTAFQALRWLAGLQSGEWLLVHAGASGVGTAAIQLARTMGAHTIVTASSGKHTLCKELGAVYAIDYREQDFEEAVLEYTHGKGVDVAVDFIGGPYFQQNLNVLALEGRLVMLAFLGGVHAGQLNLGPILRKRLQVTGSTLRARSLDYKIRLSQGLYRYAWPLFAEGKLRPIVDTVFDWKDVAKAHRYMEDNRNQGKVILKVG
ncbi:MAG: NAD(P)H-quinone oxidoreductase [Phaeodactylibacter sp.]|nr:NAD(P)H-quinone oxidoreductase [Phaeodactylibacter sp.]